MEPEKLRETLGACLTHARKYMATFLKKKAVGVPFQDTTLAQLLLQNPGRKFKGFLYFARKTMPPYFRPCLTVTMPDLTVHIVPWATCLQHLYGHHKPEQVKKLRAIRAFREEISTSPKMQEARRKFNVGKCEGCFKKTKLHIDHDVVPFAQLLDEFLESKKLELCKVSIDFRARPYKLMSRKLAADWVRYHDDNATLQGLCKSCNCVKGSGGYRHKK